MDADIPDAAAYITSNKSEQTPAYGEAGHHDGDHRHKFDKDIERGTGCVLEGVADGIAGYCGLMHIAALAAEVAFLHILPDFDTFRAIPCDDC